MISSASEVGVVFFLLQVILGAGVTMGPVIQAPDQTSLDVGGWWTRSLDTIKSVLVLVGIL